MISEKNIPIDILYQNIFDNQSMGIIIGNDHGEIVDVNKRFCEMIGYDKNTLVGISDWFFVDKHDHQEKKSEFITFMSDNDFSRRGLEFIRKYIHKDGYSVWVRLNVSKTIVNDQRLAISVVEDITEKIRAEEKLVENNKIINDVRSILDDALNSSNDPIAIYSSEGKIMYFNPSFSSLWMTYFKKIEVDVLYIELMNIYFNNNEKRIYETKSEWLTNRAVGFFRENEIKELTFNDRVFIVSSNSGANGRIIQVYKDITEFKEKEQELVQEKIRSNIASQSKSIFINSMSHELRTPLNSILGFSDLILSEIDGPINNSLYKEYLENIRSSGKNLLGLISDILDVAQLDTDNVSLYDSIIELDTFIKSFIKNSFRLSEHKEISFIYDTTNQHILFDESRFKQVIYHIIANSINAIELKGTIKISFNETSSGSLIISIKDDGIGIPSKKIKDIFEPFIKHNVVKNQTYSGTGLGLHIVKKILNLHDCDIDIISKENVGTEVLITIPDERVVG